MAKMDPLKFGFSKRPRVEGSPDDVPLVNGFNCCQRCEDVFKWSSMKTS